MPKNIFLLLLSLTLFVTGCNQTEPENKPEKVFDLNKVNKQYGNIDFKIADISEQSYQNGAALAITFSSPLNPATDIQSFLKVSNKQGQSIPGSWIVSANGLVAYFPDINPSSDYTVDVLSGLTAATGKKLKASVNLTIKTRNMASQVSFASRGSVLPAKLAKGLPVVSVNIDEVDVDFHRIHPDKLNHFISSWHTGSGRSSQSAYYIKEYANYAKLVYSARFPLNPPKNTRYTTHLDLNSIKQLKQPGIYLAVMKPAGSYEYEKQVSFFTVSDIGLHIRKYSGQMNIQVSSLATGKPLSGVYLSLIDAKENVLHEIQSDQQGNANIISPLAKAQLLVAKKNNNIALLKLDKAALDLSEFNITGRPHKPIEIFSYGPRDLYRPGETVKINVLLRDADGQNITAPPLNAVLKRPDGQKIKYFTLYPNNDLKTQGFYQTEYHLPSSARTGQWTLELSTANKNKHQYHFQVQAFLPERMELLLGEQPAKEHWTNSSDAITVPVSGQYLYGAPAANNRLSTKVTLKHNRQPIKSLKDYYFGLADEKLPVEYYEQDDIKLNEKGLATLKIASRWQSIKNTPLSIKIIASLFETGGRPVIRSIDYLSWPQQTLIGIRPHNKLSDIPADAQISFDLVKSNLQGKLSEQPTEVLATLIKERRDYFWEYSDAEGWHSDYTEKKFSVFEQRLQLNTDATTTVKVPVEWGSYLLKVKDLQSGQTSSLRFQAGNGWRHQANESSARPERVVLKLDKKQYHAGDTVQLHIIPPYQGNGFVMLENSEQPLWSKRVNIPAAGMTVKIPLNKDWNRHDLYISSVIFRAGNAKEKITPNRAIGLIHLPLNREKQHLSVAITASESPIRPEQNLATRIKVAGFDADKPAYVMLAAVDVGVLNITDFQTPDPHQWFYQARGYTVDQHDMYNKIIELSQGGLAKPRFGGDADKHAGGARPDSSVKIVSLQSQLIKTNEQGVATINLDIPDFNGRLRLMAVAFNDNQFGSAQAEVTVSAPIIAESSLPRFLASGDTSTLTLDLRNQSGQEQNLSLNISANSPLQLTNKNMSVVLKVQEKQVFHFPIRADHAFGASQINLSLQNQDQSISINRKWQLGVRPAYPATQTVQRQIIHSDETASIHPPLQDLLLSSANSELNLSSHPPLAIKQHLKSLLQYPYGCLEQTISSTYPWLSITQQNLASLELDKIKINNKVISLKSKPEQIDKGISRLASMQRNNGSFGLWSNTDQEEHWLTAYAVDFLLDSREKGFNVADELLNKALIRLTQYLNHRGNMYGERYSQAPKNYSFAYKAYAAYVLSRVNRAPLGSLRTLFDHHRKDLKSALPLTHLGLALYQQGDKKRGIQSIAESLTKPRDNIIYLGDYGSRLRDMSLLTYLLNKHPVPIEETKLLIFQLADELNNRQYLSTQERNALFRTAVQLKNQKQKQWQGELILDSISTKLQQTPPYTAQFSGSSIPKNIQFNSQSESPVYLQFSVNAYPSSAPKMQMNEIKIERNYYDLNGNRIKPEQHKTGDVLLVHLNIIADRRISDALVIDLLPAGFELENQDLSNNLKIDDFKITNKTIEQMQPFSQVKYQQYLDDRFVAAVDLHKNRTEHMFYLMRAVTNGQYTNPPTYVEDMYRPYIRAIGRPFNNINVISK